jgi:hypothetical protein
VLRLVFLWPVDFVTLYGAVLLAIGLATVVALLISAVVSTLNRP